MIEVCVCVCVCVRVCVCVEAKELVERMKRFDCGDKIFVSGVGYHATQCMVRSLSGRLGEEGVCVMKTKSTLVIGHYNTAHDHLPGLCMHQVAELAKDLLLKNF